ncbi:MAG TPA: ATPase domain-containing protein [Nitrospiraceae bacterium]|nr:ATPase domain-containing protein [Nitrospiraceae bacterium]
MASTNETLQGFASTGISMLDAVLGGGLARNRVFLIQGTPGAGKTTLALQFLLAGAAAGEKTVYLTLSESRKELEAVARAYGWSLEQIVIKEVMPSLKSLQGESHYTMYHPSEVELGEVIKSLLADLDTTQPDRVVIDALSDLRMLAEHPLRYRRQVLALKQFFLTQQCTVLLLDDNINGHDEHQIRSVVHGVILLERWTPVYGGERRRLEITKIRGAKYQGGFHDYIIRRGGIEVFPRLVAAETRISSADGRGATVKCGVPGLDTLLGGGLNAGTSTLFMGPSGVGKSTVASQYALAAAQRGEPVLVFNFDETTETYLERSSGLGMDLYPYMKSGLVQMRQIDPAEVSPGEFADELRKAVSRHGVRLVIIDSLNGYLHAMPEERSLVLHLHELLTYLAQHDVTTILILAEHGMVGGTQTSIEASYLADTIILFRFFEAEAAIRHAISVLKKRRGRHEKTVRELIIGETGAGTGIEVGPPLRRFRHVLSGTATYSGDGE